MEIPSLSRIVLQKDLNKGIVKVEKDFSLRPHSNDLVQAIFDAGSELGEVSSIDDVKFNKPCPPRVHIEITKIALFNFAKNRGLCTATLKNKKGEKFIVSVVAADSEENTVNDYLPKDELPMKNEDWYPGGDRAFCASFSIDNSEDSISFLVKAIGQVTNNACHHYPEYNFEIMRQVEPLSVVKELSHLQELRHSKKLTVWAKLVNVRRKGQFLSLTVNFSVTGDEGSHFLGTAERTVVPKSYLTS